MPDIKELIAQKADIKTTPNCFSWNYLNLHWLQQFQIGAYTYFYRWGTGNTESLHGGRSALFESVLYGQISCKRISGRGNVRSKALCESVKLNSEKLQNPSQATALPMNAGWGSFKINHEENSYPKSIEFTLLIEQLYITG